MGSRGDQRGVQWSGAVGVNFTLYSCNFTVKGNYVVLHCETLMNTKTHNVTDKG